MTTGGTNLRDDIMRLQKSVDIVVGTPGRVLDLANKKVLRLSKCKMLILDEADKLISEDFQPIIEDIMEYLSRKR